MAARAPSMLATLMQVELAGAWAVADAMRRHTESSLRQAESLAETLLVVAREPFRRGAGVWDLLFAEAAAGYRDYMREIAASPGLAAMSFLEHLDRLRAGHHRSDASGGDVDTDRPRS